MEQTINTFTVDFIGAQYYLDIHKALKDGLKLPEYYGENLDALWDCLTDIVYRYVEIRLKNYQDIEKINKEYSEKILYVFKEAKHYADETYSGSRIIVERDGVETEIE
ncbi:MAG: barstar family protein [Clostridia bacterium]|nr:barstar family protein [Clostridia bacterium]